MTDQEAHIDTPVQVPANPAPAPEWVAAFKTEVAAAVAAAVGVAIVETRAAMVEAVTVAATGSEARDATTVALLDAIIEGFNRRAQQATDYHLATTQAIAEMSARVETAVQAAVSADRAAATATITSEAATNAAVNASTNAAAAAKSAAAAEDAARQTHAAVIKAEKVVADTGVKVDLLGGWVKSLGSLIAGPRPPAGETVMGILGRVATAVSAKPKPAAKPAVKKPKVPAA